MRKCIILFAMFVFACVAFSKEAATPAEDLFTKTERHLQKLKSLEVVYGAEGAAFPEGGQSGRMVWVRPDGFYHDTPEWTMAQRGRERWRYLKEQQTLILEDVRAEEPLLPEQVFFALREDVKPETLEADPEEGGAHKLTLRATAENSEGMIWLWLRQGAVTPFKLAWPLVDGSVITYRVESWQEEMPVDNALFVAPQTEHVIDFRENKGQELR
ncbi:MAG: hypothetical protein V1784_06680 [bacterium]